GRVEEAASGQEPELREILDLGPDHIVVFGAAGKRIYANRAVLEHYGWTIEYVQTSEFDGLVRDILHPEDVDTFWAACERGFAGSSELEAEARSRRHGGV